MVLWTTKDGREIPIAELGDAHLVNCANMLLRARRLQLLDSAMGAMAYSCSTSAEMAGDAAQSEADYMLDASTTVAGCLEYTDSVLLKTLAWEIHGRRLWKISATCSFQFAVPVEKTVGNGASQ